MEKLIQNPSIKKSGYFLIMLGLLWLIWRVAFHFIWNDFNLLMHYRQFALGVIDNLVFLAYQFVSFLGYEATYQIDERLLRIGYSGGVTVGEPCSGISLWAVYIGLIIAYPSKLPLKLTFIPLGVLGIHLINVLRVAALAIISLEYPAWLNFNHDFLFQVIVLGSIMLTWAAFVKTSRK